MLLRQTLIVLLKSKIDKDALLIGIGACFSLAQGMTANDSVTENILVKHNLDWFVCAAVSYFGFWILRRNERTNFIGTPCFSDGEGEEKTTVYHCEHFKRKFHWIFYRLIWSSLLVSIIKYQAMISNCKREAKDKKRPLT